MTATVSALAHLEELPLPPEVSYAPQTMGWLVVAVLLLVGAAWIAWRIHRRRQRNRYRLDALAELNTLEQRLSTSPLAADALAAIPGLIKRTALAFTPRERIAALTAEEWLAYLDTTDPQQRFARGPGSALADLAYGSPAHLAAMSRTEVTALLDLTRDWIRHHHAPV